MEDYKLSQEEIDAIAEKVCEKFQNRLYSNVGSGVLHLFWKGIIIIVIAIAAYGVGAGFHMFK